MSNRSFKNELEIKVKYKDLDLAIKQLNKLLDEAQKKFTALGSEERKTPEVKNEKEKT